MKKKNKKILIFTALGILTVIGVTALQHGGRTDSWGGHNDHKRGTYHYHR